MTLPENFEQLGEAQLVWMEDNSHHLSVAGHTCKTQPTGLSSTTDTLQTYTDKTSQCPLESSYSCVADDDVPQ